MAYWKGYNNYGTSYGGSSYYGSNYYGGVYDEEANGSSAFVASGRKS